MNSAILVAAGKGTRMGADKLFLELAGRPVIAHTWQRFNDSQCIGEIIVVQMISKRSSEPPAAIDLKRLIWGGHCQR